MDTTADSPTSVLKEEEISNEEIKQQISSDSEIGSIAEAEVDKALPLELETMNGNASLISETMTKVKEEITETRTKVTIEAKLDPGFKEISNEEMKQKISSDSEIGSIANDEDDEAMNGNASLISETMAKVEEELSEARAKEEFEVKLNPNFKFNKLDELLTQTKLYSEFLLEKMDDITMMNTTEIKDEVVNEDTSKGKKGRKRKATQSAAKYNTRRTKTAVAAMLTRSHEAIAPEDACLTEEERATKEQAELVPLMTGGKLKTYQIKGVKWLISLWQNGLNGILADQMGLGKTVQTLGFLAHLKGKGLDGPYMVIAPLSTLSNWVNEVQRFVPSMTAIIYHGTKSERTELRRKFMPKSIGSEFPLIITSYEVALRDAPPLSHYKWKYVVVDEGHRLKNKDCLLLRELRRLPIENKLLLTGTPLQNNLAELWSLLNFILPDIFSSHAEFESWFDLSGRGYNDSQQEESEENRRVQVVSKLHSILRPFLLRRVKVDVEKNLPLKKEIILYATMTEHQKEIQHHLVNKTIGQYLEENLTGVPIKGMKGKLNNLLIQLRKNCNHPDLIESVCDGSYFYPPVKQLVEQCGKFRLLDRLMTLLLARRHKVLIFSQWTKVLNIIEYFLGEKGIEVCRIDGNVKLHERKRQMEEFNDLNSTVSVFLLSTRAGGLGINLTAADTCILYDSDWNPQMDLQAMDRCHRIGQTRPVHVYRLATAHSVEGRIMKKAFGKLRLEHVVISTGQFQQDRVKPNTLEEFELLALLREEEDAEDKLTQTDISDGDLVRVMDRSDLVVDGGLETEPGGGTGEPFPLQGPGWEVVISANSSAGVLSSLGS